MTKTKRSFIMSLLSLLLCFAMLIGTTYAWFTDSVTSGKNQIVAGNLDVEMYHWNKNVGTESSPKTVADATDLFETDLWEPGKVVYENFKVANVGTLALTYQFAMNVFDYNTVTRDDGEHALSEILKVIILDGESFSGTREDAIAKFTAAGDNAKTIADFSDKGYLMPKGQSGTLYNKDVNDSKTFAVLIYWEPSDADNIYNVNNNATVNTSVKGITASAANNALFVELGINLVATQIPYEKDSFDEKYDAAANFPVIDSSSVTIPVTNRTAVAELPVAPEQNSTTKVTFTDLPEGTTTIKVDEEIHDILASNKSFTVSAGNAAAATVDLTLYVNEAATETSEGFKAKVETTVAKGMKNVTINYQGDASKVFGASGTRNKKSTEAEVTAPGDYFYDAKTGRLVFMTDHFSEYVVGTTSEAYIGKMGTAQDAKAVNTAYDTVADALDAISAAGITNLKLVGVVLLKDCEYTACKAIEFDVDVSYGHKLTIINLNDEFYVEKTDHTSNVDYKITKIDYVCQKGEKKFKTLTDALHDTTQTGDIVLLRDVDTFTNEPLVGGGLGNVASNSDKDFQTVAIGGFVIDLAGHSITTSTTGEKITVAISDSSLTVKDSSEGNTGNISGIYLSNSNLTLDDVKISDDCGMIAFVTQNNEIKVNNSEITISTCFVSIAKNKTPTITLTSGKMINNSTSGAFNYSNKSQTSVGTITRTSEFEVTGSGKLSNNSNLSSITVK